MHIIAKKALEDFWRRQPTARPALEAWYKIASRSNFAGFADVRRTFQAADYVSPFTVFDVGGNKFRIIAAIHYNRQKIYIRHVFTHAEYDRWCKQQRSKRQ